MKKIVFCGFGKLGKECLKTLVAEKHKIDFVMTHKENLVDSVDTFSEESGIEYTYIDSRKKEQFILNKLYDIKPDVLVSVNYRYIIPKSVSDVPEYSINIHGSLLPKYRGRTPHVWSIINGEKESGITSHIIEKTVDTGDIISQINIPIEDDDTGFTLLKKYEKNYPSLLIDTIDKLNENEKFIKQNEEKASFYGKRTPDMGYIDFRKEAKEVINFVRAQAKPYPGAFYYLLDGKKIIINEVIESDVTDFNYPIGVIREAKNKYYVRCKDKVLRLKDYKITV